MLNHGDYWLVVGDKLRIARERAQNEDGSITADLYRNQDDYSAGRVPSRSTSANTASFLRGLRKARFLALPPT